MHTSYTTKGALSAVVVVSVLAISACGATSTPAPAAGATGPAATSAMSSTAAGMPMPQAPAGPHNQADVTFAQMMTVHHRSAVQMADLAPSRAASSQVKDLAAKIKAAQEPEIKQMTGWLAAWAPDTDMNGMPQSTAPSTAGMDGMGSSAMPGMMSAHQMSQLTAASGSAFDKLFLTLMIAHHQGAVQMAKTEKAQGANPAALKLADSITASQTAEIAQMEALLKGM